MTSLFITLIFIFLILGLSLWPVAMIYALILLFFVLTVVIALSLFNGLTSFLPFILVSIYLGAMMIMVGYICAVIPNVKLVFKGSLFYWLAPLSFFSLLFGSEMPIMLPVASSSSEELLSLFFYGCTGVYFFSLMVLFLLLLMVVPGLCIPYTAPLRSVTLLSYSVEA